MAKVINYIENKRTRVKSQIKHIIIDFIVIVVVAIGMYIFFNHKYSQEPIIQVVRDTVVLRDTFNFTKTEIEFRDRYFYDTVEIERVVYIRDTPQTYVDSTDKYKLEINAVKLYDYSLDIYTTDSTFYTTEVVKEKESFWKNRFTITAGFGVQYGLIYKQVDIGPQITVGVRLW